MTRTPAEPGKSRPFPSNDRYDLLVRCTDRLNWPNFVIELFERVYGLATSQPISLDNITGMPGEVGVELRAGARLRSVLSSTEVIVVKPPSFRVEFHCGGSPMVPVSDQTPVSGVVADDGETLVGKRYEHQASGLLVLCAKGGKGTLSIDGTPMPIQNTRALPSSD